MESTNTLETFLWLLAGLIGSGMIAFLTLGWFKGNQWQREMKMRKHRSQHR
ncbi:MAG: hypothetical protein K8F30_06575 [Taibaiella sp.]|nr:hypothetical protein [Taibaiella sp.]